MYFRCRLFLREVRGGSSFVENFASSPEDTLSRVEHGYFLGLPQHFSVIGIGHKSYSL